MRFLGTGGGEGVPNPFCTCRICENARKVGGKEIRTRSSFRLDNETIIDIGADFFTQSFMLNEPFDNIRNVLYTHTHDDHFNYTMIWERFVRNLGGDGPMNIYFTDSAYDILDKFYLVSPVTEGRENYITPENIRFIRLNFMEKYNIGQWNVTPLKGNHSTVFEKNSANYLLENNNISIFYAVDSGPFSDETIGFLSGAKLNILICECTFPVIGIDYLPAKSEHMDLNSCLKNLDVLYTKNIISKETKIYITHISPVGSTHAEFEQYVNSLDLPYKITVAYDGMVID